MHLLVTATWLLAGCHHVFGVPPGVSPDHDGDAVDAPEVVDIDADQVPDDIDDCLRDDALDNARDEDATAPINELDPCPLDAATTADSDGDPLLAPCDPLPTHGIRRCLMAFESGEINEALWRQREPQAAWSHGPGALAFESSGPEMYTMIASRDLAGGGTTTLDALVEISNATSNTAIVLRTHANLSVSDHPVPDAGCIVSVTNGDYRLQVAGDGSDGSQLLVGTATAPVVVRLRATYVPGTDSTSRIRCDAHLPGDPWSTSESLVRVPVPGHVGFAARDTTVRIEALDFLEH